MTVPDNPGYPWQAWLVPPADGPPIADEFRLVTGIDTLNKPGRGRHQRLGMWTSTWLGPPQLSAWAEWCAAEQFAGPDWQVWLLTVAPDAQIWTIDQLVDLERLLARYGAEGDMFRVLGRHSMFPEIDFDRFTGDGYVGIHLTEDGQWNTRMPLDVDAPSLYGWDCESTLWCRWAFTEVEDLGVITYDGGDEPGS